LIAVVLAGGISTAIVKSSNETKPVVQSTPTQTFTFTGPPPTVPTETPVVTPTESPSSTATTSGLANTGITSTAAVATLMIAMALAGGWVVRRTARAGR